VTSLPLVLETYLDPPSRSQAPGFIATQRNLHDRDPAHFLALQQIVLRVAGARGDRGFTSDDVREEPGWAEIAALTRTRSRQKLPGIIIGSLRSSHSLCSTMKTEKSRLPQAKGRRIYRFYLNVEAIRVPGPAEAQEGEVPER